MEIIDELHAKRIADDRHAAFGLLEPFLHPLHEFLLLHDFVAGRVNVKHDLVNGISFVEVNIVEVDPNDERVHLGPGEGVALIHVNLVEQSAYELKKS